MASVNNDRILQAAQRNRADVIRELISVDKVPPDHGNAVGQTALHVACIWGHAECVVALIEGKAPVNAQNKLTAATPLHCAVSSSKRPLEGRMECARLLIAAGADAYLPDRRGCTPVDMLEEDIENGILDDNELADRFRKVLLGPNGDNSSSTPIAFQQIDNLDVDGIERWAGDDNGTCLQALEDHEKRSGLTPLQYALEKFLKSDLDEPSEGSDDEKEALASIISSFVRAGADVNAEELRRRRRMDDFAPTDDGSDRPIHQLCLALSKLYTQSSSSTDAPPSLLASVTSTESVISILVNEGGATVPKPTVLLLHDACRRGNLRMIEFLLNDVHVDVNTRGRQGLTPLHFAARSGRKDVAEMLLSHGVNTSVVDDRGKTAIEAARVNGKEEIVQMLEKYSK